MTAASRRLHVVQQALSRTVADAERLAGLRIFERAPRGMRVTGAGRRVVASARAALGAIEQVRAAARAVLVDADTVRVGLADCGVAALGQRSAFLALRDRGVATVPVPVPIVRHLEGVRDGRLDVGFALGFTDAVRARAGDDVAVHVLADAPAVGAMLPAWHPLAAQPSVDPAALSDLPLLEWPRALVPDEVDHILARLGEAGWRGSLGPAIEDGMVIGQMIAAGAGWAYVSDTYDGLLPPSLVVRPLTRGAGAP